MFVLFWLFFFRNLMGHRWNPSPSPYITKTMFQLQRVRFIAGMKSPTKNADENFQKKAKNLIFWSVLQDRIKTKAEQVDAIMSLHTYVGHSSCFMILAPVQHHYESNEILSFSSWRSRGWCQFELATAMLLGTKPVLLISSKGAVMHLFHRNSAVGKTWRKSYNL